MATNASQFARILGNYRNADGRFPDGLEDDADDTQALRLALAEGPGLVFVPPGSYRFGDVTVPPGVTFFGAGQGTVVRLAKGAKRIFHQKDVNDWRLRDMRLDGGAALESWPTRQDLGEHGVEASGCSGFEISGLVVNNFNGAGIHLSHTAASPYCQWATAAAVFNIAAGGNHTGIRLDTRAEYMNASMLTCQGNSIGCAIHGGNVKIANSNFTNNLTGMLIEDHDNGSHGAISNCLLNHNRQWALRARHVAHGMCLDNCAFFCGGIHLEHCKGVNISASIIACNVTTLGDGVNRIANNFMIIRNETFDFSPTTIIESNFTDKGPWEKNSPR
ncbi:MAG: hypothetical protein HY343_01345 [Lentisphaerae bacterium]|nr:hypothetical protein [Lentisphaerota bacterium]